MEIVKTPGFIEIASSHHRKIVWYYTKNITNLSSYQSFLQSIKSELIERLRNSAYTRPIKFNLKLEASYNRPNIENSSENRAFTTSAKEIFSDTNIEKVINEVFTNLLSDEDMYMARGSGFTLQKIDGLLLAVYRYTPMGGSSYIPLPSDIQNKKAVINPQNTDQQCFKWAILAKHVTGLNKLRVGENYKKHENKYNFTGVNFPTPLSDVKIFEKNNPDVSINVYSLKKEKQKNIIKNILFPLKVVEEEKPDHFDILLVTDIGKSHYSYIKNFSRLVRSQKTMHNGHVFMCKKCFTSFDNQKKFKLSGQAALDEHKVICGPHNPILPIMPKEGETVKFESWNKTQRHPIVIYADFEALLLKITESKGKNTTAFQSHHPMSYGFYVKSSNDVSKELLEKFDIPQSPIIFRGSESSNEVAKQFMETIVEVAKRVEKLLKTNIPIIMSTEQHQQHSIADTCNLCKTGFTSKNPKIADHNHLSGYFRQTLCNNCNLKLQTPKFVPCFFHNLSNYDAHFIVRQLGYDTNIIKVIPNSEEKYISFSKFISNTFAIRFIDTFRFMTSSLSTLASNLLTNDFSKFRETAKVFTTEDLPLVTRKGVYPYEYTDSWAKLEETRLPPKEEFYSTLAETNINDMDYELAKKVWNHFKCDTLGEYSDLYLKVDVLLLADVFENFRDICMRTYSLDPAYYYTAPGLSFDSMLKLTCIKLELLSDYDMLLMFEKGIFLSFIY